MENSTTPPDPKVTLEKMLALMGIEGKVEQLTSDGVPVLHIDTEDAGRLIGIGDVGAMVDYRGLSCRNH